MLEYFDMAVLQPSGRAFGGRRKVGERSWRDLYLGFPELKPGAAECPEATMFYSRSGPAGSLWVSIPAGSCRLTLDQVAQAVGESWQGTFSGTLHSTMESRKPLTITDGHFTVLRTE